MNTHPVILFDGVCNLCNSSVQFILRRDKKGIFRFASLQSPQGQHLLGAFGKSGQPLDSIVLISDDRLYSHSDAALLITKNLGGAWPLLSYLRIIPKGLRDMAYQFIATNRYKWFGKSDECMLPRPEWKERFLNDKL